MKGKRRLLIYGLVITIISIAAGVWFAPGAGLVAAVVGFVAAVGANLVSASLEEYTGRSGSPTATGVEDTRPSLVLPPETRRARLARRRRSIIKFGLAVSLLLLAGIGSVIALYYFTTSPSPVPATLILVANFDEVDQTNYRVTDTLVQTLTQAFQDDPKVRIERIDRRFRAGEDNAVRELGTQRDATIVIWGWYGQTDAKVALSVHFEVIPTLQKLPQLRREVAGSPQVLDSADLKSFAMQIDLSHEMTYLSLFVVGLIQSVNNEFDAAISSFTDALNMGPPTTISQALERGPVYYYRGMTYLYKGEYDRAIADYDQAIMLDPKNADAYNNRGNAYSYKGEFNQAIADFDQAIILNPSNADAYNNRGIAYSDKGEFNQGIADLTEAIKLDSDNTRVYNNRGIAYSLQGKYDQAIADFDQAIILNPNDADAYYNRAITYSLQGKYDQAIADYGRVIKIDPDNTKVYNNRGIAYSLQGKYDQAIADFDQAIKIDPSYAFAYHNRGIAYSDKGEYDQAIADYDQAIKLDPNDAVAYYNRGLANQRIGKKMVAISDFEKVLALSNDAELQTDAEAQLRMLGAR